MVSRRDTLIAANERIFKRSMKKQHIVITAVFLLCMLFTYAGLVKALYYHVFVTDMGKSPLLVKYDKARLAPLVPGTEFLIVLLLGFEATRKACLYLSFFVMSVSHYASAYCISSLPTSPAPAEVSWERFLTPTHITFNAVFTLIAGTGAILSK